MTRSHLIGVAVTFVLSAFFIPRLNKAKLLLFSVALPSVTALSIHYLVGGSDLSLQKEFTVTFGSVCLFMGWAAISGRYLHQTKKGNADRRYKVNPYLYTFSIETRKKASICFVVTLALAVITVAL